MEERLNVAESVTTGLLTDMNAQWDATEVSHLDGLAWSLNESGSHPYGDPAFDTQRLAQLQTLLAHLESIGFKGTVRLTSHLGEFCLVSDRLGELQPAPADTPVEACGIIGHPLDDSRFPGDRETPEFADFMDQRGETANGITVELVALDRFASTQRFPYPETGGTAADWNAVAERNQRVEYEFLPAKGS
jgi:hypothetical protein